MERQESLEAIDRARTFLRKPRELAVHLPPIFLLHRRYVQDPPVPAFARGVTEQQTQQRRGVETIRLRATRSSRDLDTGRIDHQGDDPRGRARALQPEAVAARFVAQHHRRVRRQATMLTRAREFRVQPGEGARREHPHAGRRGHRWSAGQAPARVAEIQGNV
jgi:hypothetical protein